MKLLDQLAAHIRDLEAEALYWKQRAVGLGAVAEEREKTVVVAETNGNGNGHVEGPLPPGVPGSSTQLQKLIRDLRDGFTVSELASAANRPVKDIKKVVDAMVLGGSLERTGSFRGQTMFVFKKPDFNDAPNNHPTKPPAEYDPPSYTEVPRRGEPVRTSKKNRSRREQSMAGSAHRMKLRDKRHDEMQEAILRRMAEQKARPAKDPKRKRRKK